MSWQWNDYLRLPDRALEGDKRVPKTMLARQALLTKREQKVLDRVARVGHFATAQRDTMRLLPHVDDLWEIRAAAFLHCEMAGPWAGNAEVIRLLHKCFPRPTVLLVDAEDVHCLSVAITRRSMAEHGMTVLDTIDSSGEFREGDASWDGFLDAIAFDRLSQEDLLTYLRALAGCARLAKAIPVIGLYPRCSVADADALFCLIARDEALRAEERSVRERRKNGSLTLNETAKLRMKLKAIESERAKLASEMKELCHG